MSTLEKILLRYTSLGDRGLLHGTPSVTGYSLGGHLAAAFNLLHFGSAAAPQVVTFNGAGVGDNNEDRRRLAA
jgi:hypothetical protein